MSRILFFVLLALAIYLCWRLLQSKQLPRDGKADRLAELPMVSCETCGLHVPRDEALSDEARYYCSEEHRRQAPRG